MILTWDIVGTWTAIVTLGLALILSIISAARKNGALEEKVKMLEAAVITNDKQHNEMVEERDSKLGKLTDLTYANNRSIGEFASIPQTLRDLGDKVDKILMMLATKQPARRT